MLVLVVSGGGHACALNLAHLIEIVVSLAALFEAIGHPSSPFVMALAGRCEAELRFFSSRQIGR